MDEFILPKPPFMNKFYIEMAVLRSQISDLEMFYVSFFSEMPRLKKQGHKSYVYMLTKAERNLLTSLGFNVELHDNPEYEALADESTNKIGYRVWFK